MADLTYTATLDDKISPALAKIQAQTKKTTEIFGRFQTALAGLAVGAAIQNALAFADAIVDISDASEIGIANVIGFGKAVEQLGGNTEKAQSAIAKFGLTVGEAQNGGLSAQNSFRDLGITLDDLAKLDTQGLFDLTLKRLGELDSVTQRNRISSELFGKTLRGVDLRSLSASYENLTVASAKYAEDVRRGAELQDKLGAAFGKLKLEILKAIEPLVNFVNQLKPEQIEQFVEAVVKIGGAAVSLVALAKGVGLVTSVFTQLSVAVGLAYAAVKAGFLNITGGMAALSKISLTVRNLFVNLFQLLSIGFTSISGIIGRIGTSFNLIRGALLLIAAPLGLIGLGFGKILLVLTAISLIVYAVDRGFKALFDISPIDYFIDKLNKAYVGLKEFIGLGSGVQTPVAPDPREGARGRGDPAEIASRKTAAEAAEREKAAAIAVRKELELKISAIRQGTEEFRKGLNDQIESVRLNRQLIGQSELQKEILQATAAITKDAANKTLDLTKAMSQLQGTEKDQLTPVYQAQIAAIEMLRKAKILEITEALKGNAAVKAAEDLRLFGIREQQQVSDDLLRIRRDLAQIGLGDSARQQMDVAAAADERARAEIRALEASRGVALTEAEKNRIFEISRQQLGAVAAATLQLSTAQEAYAQSQAATNFSLKSANDLLDKQLDLDRQIADVGLLEIEKAYRDIIRATEDSARAAIRAEEDRRSAIAGTRVLLDPSEVAAYYEAAKRGSESLVSSQKKLYDSSRTFSTGWSSAFKRYVEDATNAAQRAERMFAKFTQGLEDLIVDFAKTGKFEFESLFASLAEELFRSQIRETLASLGSALGFGNLFGGTGSANARGSSATNPMYVIDVAGGGIGGGGNILTGGGAGGGGGILDSIGGLFSSVTSGIGDFFSGFTGPEQLSGPGMSGGGILDTIGNFFSGFFANGGMIPAGKFGIVGENGPEFAAGPATIMPMGGGGGSVTYNINAVDARSFQALLAQDPGFLHAVVQQGARGIPQRR